MSDPKDKDDRQASDFASLPALLKEWQGVVVTLVVTLGGAAAAVLAVLLPEKPSATVQVIGYAAAVLTLAVGGFVFYRVRRRQQTHRLRERRRETWERETAGAHLTAFRGLFPYQEGDELPGEHRQIEARRLVTQFSEPTFSFGVVCGDSGCGKTSLLRSAIQSRLKAVGAERGFNVLYLSNPRELAEDGERADAARRLRGELDRLGQLAAGAAQGRPLILIIDQFEEFFIEYSSPELRQELGRFLNGLIKSSPPVRILCAIRRDYLADIKDLAPPSPDPAADRSFFELISFQSLFTLKNFMVEQAARVIRECAERDRVEVDDELADTLASDLGEGGFVRPPELQIVCTALVGNPTMAEYRLAGGARGILSHYIADAIDVSGDPNVGRRVLRALCDFPAHAKRNPQTVAELAEAVGTGGAQASGLLRTALRQFEVARLVVSEKRGEEEPGFALVHDYLVDAVSKATSDVSTRDEEANQLLEYYVAEYRTDRKTRIPYRRLRFVRKYADRKNLADPTARRLVRASITRLATSAVALIALVVVATTFLAAFITTSRVWHQEVVGNHWEGSEYGDVEWIVQPKRGLLLTGISEEWGDNNVRLWKVNTATLLHHIKSDSLKYIPPDHVLGYSAAATSLTALHIPTARTFQTGISSELLDKDSGLSGSEIAVSASGTAIAIRGIESFDLVNDELIYTPPPPVNVFSVAHGRLAGEMPACESWGGTVRVSDDGEYVLSQCHEDNDKNLTAFNMRAKEKKVLTTPGRDVMVWEFNDRKFRVASLEWADDDRYYLVLWDVRTAQALNQTEVPPQFDAESHFDGTVSFTPDGEFIYVSNTSSADEIKRSLAVYRTDGLGRVTSVPEKGVRILEADDQDNDAAKGKVLLLAWPNAPGGTYLWDLREAEPRLLAEFTLPEDSSIPNVSMSTAGVRAFLLADEETRAELWDFKTGKKLRDLDIPGRFNLVEFTIGGNAVSVSLEDGTVSLFRADNGEKITDGLRNIGGSRQAIFYDEKCRRAHVWTDKGRVLRYTYGWRLFGRESWFWPAEKCETQ